MSATTFNLKKLGIESILNKWKRPKVAAIHLDYLRNHPMIKDFPTKQVADCIYLYYLNICRYDAGFDNLDLICTRTLQDQVLNAICVLLATAERLRLNENFIRAKE